MKECELTKEYINECLSYDANSGFLFWKVRPINHFKTKRAHACWNARYSHMVAGAVNKDGYLSISIDKKIYRAHRLAWFIHYGSWPSKQIDHINRNPSDNRIVNLRDVSPSENLFNRGFATKNTSRRVGVSYCQRTKKWCATFGKKRIGRFSTIEEAIESRVSFEERLLRSVEYAGNRDSARSGNAEGPGGS